jgi:hypothetical protein
MDEVPEKQRLYTPMILAADSSIRSASVLHLLRCMRSVVLRTPLQYAATTSPDVYSTCVRYRNVCLHVNASSSATAVVTLKCPVSNTDHFLS